VKSTQQIVHDTESRSEASAGPLKLAQIVPSFFKKGKQSFTGTSQIFPPLSAVLPATYDSSGINRNNRTIYKINRTTSRKKY
jgi:hypothetical protein